MALNTTFNPLAPAFAPSMDFARKPKELDFSDAMSLLVDKAISEHKKAEYKAGRGSGKGDVAYKRIGAGYIGLECTRQLAYKYHKFTAEERSDDDGGTTPGELTRHAEAGHWTETKTAEWLRIAGFNLITERRDASGIPIIGYNGKPEQLGFKVARDPVTGQARIAGELDGMIVGLPQSIPDGLPEKLQSVIAMMRTPCQWESKKGTSKKYNKFKKEGVAKADPKYYGQIQTTMAYCEVEQCLFSMLNLDTMQYYWELVDFNPAVAQQLTDRAVRVLQSQHPNEFPRISADPCSWLCRYCDYKQTCWSV